MDIENAMVRDGLLYVKLDGVVYQTVLREWSVQHFGDKFISGELHFQIMAKISQAPPETVEIEGPK